MFIHYAIIILQVLPGHLCILLRCTPNVTDKVCFEGEEYIPTISPSPLPTKVDISVRFDDIINIDVEQNTVTLLIMLQLIWYDEKLYVQRSKDYIERYNSFFNYACLNCL